MSFFSKCISLSRRIAKKFPGFGKQRILVLGSENYLFRTGFFETLAFYLPGANICIVNPIAHLSFSSTLRLLVAILRDNLVVVAEQSSQQEWNFLARRLWHNTQFNLDSQHISLVAWEWHRLVNFINPPTLDFEAQRKRFAQYVDQCKESAGDSQESYVFGTGPSLGKLRGIGRSDGWRIVCNTIVRDKELWDSLKPHFIVAVDGGYHFGPTVFARAFRHDLKNRLLETKTAFLYPANFDWLVKREMSDLSDLLFPVPVQCMPEPWNFSLLDSYWFGTGRNVLCYMLQLAATLSDKINLWGFDGRAPSDYKFWANSAKQNYEDLMWSLHKDYPAFYEASVPEDDPTKYNREVMHESLGCLLDSLEKRGAEIRMLHKSWTETLAKRYWENECQILTSDDNSSSS